MHSLIGLDSVCFDRSDLSVESLTATSDCIRAVLSVWTNILIIKMCANIGILCLSAASMQCKCTRNHLWLKIKPHVRMVHDTCSLHSVCVLLLLRVCMCVQDKEYASILSHLEIGIIAGFVAPIIIPIIAVVMIVTIYFYRMSLGLGRNLMKSDLHFPMLFLFYPFLFQQILLFSFFRIAEFEGSSILITGFIVIDLLFVGACLMLKCR